MDIGFSSENYFSFLVLAVAASAFFSASEAAFLSLGRIGESRMARLRSPFAKMACFLHARFNRLIFVALTCNLIANVLATFIAASLFQALLPSIQSYFPFLVSPLSDLAFVLGYTVFILLFAEFLPKQLAIRFSTEMALVSSLPLMISYAFFTPLVFLFNKTAQILENRFYRKQSNKPANKLKLRDSSLVFSSKEMMGYIDQGKRSGGLEQTESSLLENVVGYFDVPAKLLIIPRERMLGIEEAQLSKKNILTSIRKFPHINIPIYRGQKDDVLGIISKRHFFNYYDGEKITKEYLRRFILKPPILPETKNILDVFVDIYQSKCEVALLADEAGGIEGMVTYADIAGKLFGSTLYTSEIKNQLKPLGGNFYLAMGEISLVDFNQYFSVEIQCSEAETISGYLLEKLKHFPQKGEIILDRYFRYEIKKCDQRRIYEVLLHRRKKK